MLRILSIELLLSCAPRHKSMGFYPHAEAGGLNRRFPHIHHKAEGDHLVYESAAILAYVLDQHPESSLVPRLNSPKRGTYYQYLFWMASTLQEAANRWAHPEHYLEPSLSEDRAKSLSYVVDKATQELARCWQIIENDLAKQGPWLLGDSVSGVDYHLFMIAYWSRRYGSRAQDFPHLKQHMQVMLALPSIQNMMEQEGLSFAL